MIVRRAAAVPSTDWGHGVSRRLLVAGDRMGFTMTDTTVDAGTSSALHYARHMEACYCIQGTGQVICAVDGISHRLEPGVMYALDGHEPHRLVADSDEDLRLICVFTPALAGDERHQLTEHGFSSY